MVYFSAHVKKPVLITLVAASTLWASASWAATVRAYEKNNFSRIVIQSDKKTSYSIKEQGSSTYNIMLSGDTIDGTASIPDLSRVSNASLKDGKNLTLNLSPSATLRHFKTGKKIIIDIYGDQSKASTLKKPRNVTAPPPSQITLKKTTQKATPVVVPKVQTEEFIGQGPKVHIASDHVIQVTATETISVGAFKRHNMLWIVIDKPDFLIPPQLKGKQTSLFSSFERIELPQATAFRMPLPNADTPLYFYAEGGGLIWRLVLTTDKKKVKPSQFLKAQDKTLVWADPNSHRTITVSDPDFEDTITVITTDKVSAPHHSKTDFIELTTLSSYVGLAFLPKTEDLKVSLHNEGADISRSSGLHISDQIDIPRMPQQASITDGTPKIEDYKNMKRIFRFDEWQLGGLVELPENERLLLSGSSGKSADNRINDLMTLARLELSNNRSAEAVGFLGYIEDTYPDIKESPEFVAMLGAAHALGGQYDLAYDEFSHKLLQEYDEIALWKAYTLAGLEDWNQAGDHLPDDVGLVSLYPSPLQQKLSLVLAEIALRQGRSDDGEDLLNLVDHNLNDLSNSEVAALQYLSGEVERQNKDFKEAYSYWEPLTKGRDDLYRAKAGLALTRLMYENKEITAKQAIDKLERLRYAWRGDDLETQINYRLGLAYIEANDYIHGLNILRKAASRSPDPELAQEIAAQMADAFSDVFSTDRINELDPLDTITLFEEFSELSPTGEDGQHLVQRLAERLIEIDLLGRAATLLKNEVDNHLSGIEGARVALRLASVELTDRKPSLALKSIAKASSFLTSSPERTSKSAIDIKQGIGLLKAHAYSLLKQPDNALVALSRLYQSKQTLRMRADVAWRAGRWQAASEALEELINRENINFGAPLSAEHMNMILNWAVTLNLSDNRYVLNSIRERFGESMAGTPKADEFEVITRAHQAVFLADRRTIETIVSEVDIFKDFLTSYSSNKN